MIEKMVFAFISGLFLNSFCIFCWHKLLNKKIYLSDYKIYLALLIFCLFGSIVVLIPPFFKTIFGGMVMFIICYMFFCKNITKSIILVLYTEIIIVISELLITCVFSLLMENPLEYFSDSGITILIINIVVSIISFSFLKLKFVYRFFNYLINTFMNMQKSNLMIYFVLTVFLIVVFAIIMHMDVSLTILLIMEIVLTLFYIVILFRLANAKENYKQVTSKYETSLNSLQEYEKIMDKYRVYNHENKNQLLTIRNMINKNDKKTINYIDNLVADKIKDNENILYKVSKIPEGGLRAIIYSKLCKAADLNIKYQLDIAKDVKVINLLKIGEQTNLNICKIIGVFLDNAIEASQETKQKIINIEIFLMDNYLNINISNYYNGIIDVNKLENKKYTTKGNGRGYGLTLVKELLENDSNLKHETEISKDLFVQKLIIKM